MNPTIHVPLLNVSFASHKAALVLAVVICWWLGPRWAAHNGIARRQTYAILLWLGVAAFAGGRLHYLANTWSVGMHRSRLDVLRFWDGLHAGGAIAALVLGVLLLWRLYRMPVARFADAVMPAIAIGIAVARLGCFLNGCCFGTPCDNAWCLTFPSGSPPHGFHVAAGIVASGSEASAPIHPFQLYLAGAGILAALLGRWLETRKRHEGQAALVTLVVYLAIAAAAEFTRANYYPARYLWGGVLQFTWIAMALALAGAILLLAAELRWRHSPRGPHGLEQRWPERMLAPHTVERE